MLILFAVALLLCLGELTPSSSCCIASISSSLYCSPESTDCAGLHGLFLLPHAVRAAYTVRRQFTTSWHADAFRSWQRGPIPSLTCGRGPPLFARLKLARQRLRQPPSPVSLFSHQIQRRNSGSGFYWRYCRNRRCFSEDLIGSGSLTGSGIG